MFDNLKGITEYIKVVETGNFTAAAHELNMTRARVSQIISQLESQLGVQLLQRSTRAMKLTEVGELFYHQSLKGMNQLQQAIAMAQTEQKVVAGKIRINSVGGIFGEQILTPLICQFMNLYPQIQIDLDFSSQHIGLIESKYDLAIRMGDLPDSDLVARPLSQYKTYICASPEYASQNQFNHPQDLKRARIITGSIKKWQFTNAQNLNEQYEIEVESQFSCANGHVAKTAALLGTGVIRAPDFYVAQELRSGKLVQLFKSWQLADSKAAIVYPKSGYKTRRIKLFIDYLLSHIKAVEQAYV
ncbi:LysR family transcriptional regulator [Catenovulum maritimum]|uniref:HTH lysR-type domain-containing protein n=1 Tax=Catenovulum maritimum TaxID=1513271 RepID=A0A0J8JKD8_9ALTE|nr:LysR family transcriptional regulator [Catenovulum maritimum]KMT64936.1 hypothetical protein XM47_12065 [Catenovulum maritimum]